MTTTPVRHPGPQRPDSIPDSRPPAGQAWPPAGSSGPVPPWPIRHRWLTLILALFVVLGAGALLAGGITTTEPDEQLVGDSATANDIVESADFDRPVTENVVITARSGALDADAATAATRDLATAYRGLDGVAAVGQPARSADGTTAVLPVELDAAAGPRAGTRTAAEAVPAMLAATERVAADHPDLRIGQVGPGSIDVEVAEALEADFRRAELISLPVTLVILLVAFGAVVAAGVPVLLGLGSVVVALGLTALASRNLVAVDPNAQAMVLLIGLAVGVDYALFVLRRSREERARGAAPHQAVAIAMRTAGRAVAISGVTVVVAVSGMLVAGGLFTSLAMGTLLVVAAAVLASATVLPALLAVLGDKVDALRLPTHRGRRGRRVEATGESRLWGGLAARVTRRPLLSGSLTIALLVALAVPALGMRTALPGAESLPADFSSVDAYNRLSAAFPQDGTTVDVVVEADTANARRVQAALAQGFIGAVQLPHVVGEAPEMMVSRDARVHVLRLAVPLETSDPALTDVVDRVRSDVVPVVSSALTGTDSRVHVGGSADATDLSRWMGERLGWVVGFVLVLTLLVMLVSFGSPWLALATVGLNLLSVGAAYGVVTLVFQNSWAEGVLGFTAIGSVASWIPLIMFVILFGLSMDYHVFVVSRVREAFTAGAEPREAVRLGVARSAGVVTSAAVVMVAVFSIFATLSSLEMKQLGVGLAVAILLDATVVRGVLLPAVLTLLGRRAHTGPRWVPVLHH